MLGIVAVALIGCETQEHRRTVREGRPLNLESLDQLPNEIVRRLEANRYELKNLHTLRSSPVRNSLEMVFSLNDKPTTISVAILETPERAHGSYIVALRIAGIAPVKALTELGEEGYKAKSYRDWIIYFRAGNAIIGVTAESEKLCRELARQVLEGLNGE